jgi:hypothetical protein
MNLPALIRPLATALAGLALCAPAVPAQTSGDSVTSDNVEFVKNIREVGDGVGATVVGNTLFVTSTTHLTVYDVTDAENPVRTGVFTMNIEFENEEVPTNGKILGISGANFCVVPDTTNPQAGATGSGPSCLSIYDVSDPANVKLLSNVAGAGDHTATCLLECTYFYGSSGTIVDARDPANAKMLSENWIDALDKRYGAEFYCHHQREIQPGILLGACTQAPIISVRPEDGGSITNPAVISFNKAPEAAPGYHSGRWPRNGRDRFVMLGSETNAHPSCDDEAAPFQIWDAARARSGPAPFSFPVDQPFTLVDEFRPTNGTYTDGRNPYNALGCSVHWFEEHPTFRDGGLVAVATYENGTRFLQVSPEGRMTEQGFFQPLAGSTSAPHWHPNGKVAYLIDYTRGVDVVRWTGDTYVPVNGEVVPTPGATPGTAGKPGPPGCASAAGFKSTKVTPKGKKVAFGVERRESQPFSVDVFQQSQGSTVVKERLVARFRNKTEGFVWNGKDIKKRSLKNGFYFVRFTMRQANGQRDVRRATLERRGGKFRRAPDFYQRVDCGIFKSLKLSSSVFGGRKRVDLGIAYRLNVPAKSVKVAVRVGNTTIKTLSGKGTPNKTVRFRIRSSEVRKGKQVKVVVTPDRAGQATATYTLVARRI